MQKILIIGNGMMGGSLGMALENNGKYKVEYAGFFKINFSRPHNVVIGYDTDDNFVNVIELKDIIKKYDFFINASGVDHFHTEKLKKSFLDVSSVQYETIFKNHIFCHPICGSEKSGRENAKADLFQGKTCIITTENKEQDLIAFATDIFTDIGMNVQFCETAEEHNKNLAYTSHLIQYLAFNDNFKTLHPVFERLSNSNKEMWGKIFKKNKVNIQNALEDLLGIYVSQQTPSISEAFKILVKDIPEYFYGTALKEIIN